MQDMTTMNFRIETDLKTAFENLAKENDQTASQLLRAFIRQTVQEHAKERAQQDLFQPQGKAKTSEGSQTPRKQKKPAKTTGNALLDRLLPRAGK